MCGCIDRYFKDDLLGKCVSCDGSCNNCKGTHEWDCLECGYLAILDPYKVETSPNVFEVREGDYTCFCARGYMDPLFLTCSTCEGNCYKCTGPGRGNCELCLPGYAKIERNCFDCSENDFFHSDCPDGHQINFAETEIKSDVEEITLIIDTALPPPFLNKGLDFLIHVQLLKVTKTEIKSLEVI